MSEAQVRDNPIPLEWRERIGPLMDDPQYIAAWVYAKSKNNPPKACMIYADLHWESHPPLEGEQDAHL